MPNLASTAKLRAQVEEFKKNRGWSDAQFEAKTKDWDQGDYDEFARGWISQKTSSQRDTKLREELKGEKTKLDTEYSNKFKELAQLQANAKDAAESGNAKAIAVANRLVKEFKEDATQWAKDNELDPAKLYTKDFDSIIKQELGSSAPSNNNGNHRQQPNAQPQQGNNESLVDFEKRVQQMIADAIGGGAGRLTEMQEKIEDINDEFGLKGKNRITVSKFNNYANENGLTINTISDLESVLEEMTDAPTKRAKFADADREKWYNERHQKELNAEIEKRFGSSTTLANQMAASNMPQREKAAIFRREMAGSVKEGGDNGQANNAPPPPPVHNGPPPERSSAERRSAVIAAISNKYSQSGQQGSSG